MNRTEHKLNRLAAVARTALSPEVRLAQVRTRNGRNLVGRETRVPANAFGLRKRDLELLLLIRITPGMTSGELSRKVAYPTYPRVLARRLVILQAQGLIKDRRWRGERRWFLDDTGFEALQMFPV